MIKIKINKNKYKNLWYINSVLVAKEQINIIQSWIIDKK